MNTWCTEQGSTLEEERDQTARTAQEHNSHQPIANSPLNLPITLQEVLSAIKKLRKGKSPGPNSITNNLINGGEEVMALLLHTLHTAV